MEFRFANEKDCGLILSFIRQLASYENMSDQVVATEELLLEWIFKKKKAEVLFVSDMEKEVGFALFFHNFSTFLGRASRSSIIQEHSLRLSENPINLSASSVFRENRIS